MTVSSATSPRPPAAISPAVLVPYAQPAAGEQRYEVLTSGSDATTKTTASAYAPLTSRNIENVTAGLPMEGRVSTFRPIPARGGAAPVAVAVVVSPPIPAVATPAGIPISPPNSLSPPVVLVPGVVPLPLNRVASPSAERPPSDPRSVRVVSVTPPLPLVAERDTPSVGRVVRAPLYDQDQLVELIARIAERLPPSVVNHNNITHHHEAPKPLPESRSHTFRNYTAAAGSLVALSVTGFGAVRQWRDPSAAPAGYAWMVAAAIAQLKPSLMAEVRSVAHEAGQGAGQAAAHDLISTTQTGMELLPQYPFWGGLWNPMNLFANRIRPN